jgi:hypothetical protein
MLHGIDLSRWQTGLRIADLPASTSFVNISISKGLAAPAGIGAARQTWAADARKAGKVLLGYHWLDASAPGAEQWAACKREALTVFGSLTGWGLQLDCEADATYEHVMDFLIAARASGFHRPIAFYSGDWWLASRNWPDLAVHFPYLWATANDGWLTMAPEELSAHWLWTGKGGWEHLSLLQWSAERRIAGIAVSSTVVRTPEVLCKLTGVHLEKVVGPKALAPHA